jgi:hypothetical protein
MDNHSQVSLGLRKTREVGEYMQKRLKTGSMTNLPRKDWSLEFVQEVHNVVRVIKEAMGNRSRC